jgi:serine phosphatase RsbU (regulator of sigma subunit)
MKRWILALVLALIGLAAIGPLMDHFDLSSYWRFRLTRDQAIAEAHRLAQTHGINTTGWSPLCRTSMVTIRAMLERFQGRPAHPLFTPAEYEVSLLHPQGRRSLRIVLTADGRPVSLQQSFAAGEKTVINPVPAERLFEVYAGAFARSFRRENEGVEQGRGVVDSWIWGSPSPSESSARFEVVHEQGVLRSAQLEPRLPGDYTQRRRKEADRQMSVQTSVATVTMSLLFLVAFPVFFRGLVRGRLSGAMLWRVLLFFGVINVIAMLVNIGLATAFLARETFSPLLSTMVGQAFGVVLISAVFMLFYGAGRVMISEADAVRWFSFESAASGQWLTKPVGASLAAGVLCGCFLPVLPFIGMVLGPMPAPLLVNAREAITAFPLFIPFRTTPFHDAAALMFLVLPFRHHLKFRLGWAAYLLLGIVVVGFLRDLFDVWMWPNFLAGGVIALAYAAIYFSFDLLAVLVAHFTLHAVTLAVAVSFQPAGLRMDALEIVSLPLALLGAGLVLLWQGRTVDVPAEIARQKAALKETGSDRDRLRAEFGVARKAQLGMLPDVPERIGETTLAALCHPAREVGGDLYDFFPCPDGRYAICVADVSGKGVPASLYMSLTKGMMAAASAEATAIPELMCMLNKHLLEFGKRKMFVTMALGYYDPVSRVLEHARAGHNPVLVWSHREQKATFLQPRGVGLGLAGPVAFAKTLQVERVTLEPEDVVVFYSDGIVEAMNLAKDQFGDDRLLDAVRDTARLSADAIASEIERRVRLFAGAAPVHDDQTLFVMRVG